MAFLVSSSQTFKATQPSYSLAKWKRIITDTASFAYSNSSKHLWLNSVPQQYPVELQLPLELPRCFHFSYLSCGYTGHPMASWPALDMVQALVSLPSPAHLHVSFHNKHTMSFINQAFSLLSWEERTKDKIPLTFWTTRRHGNNSWFASKSFAGMGTAFWPFVLKRC